MYKDSFLKDLFEILENILGKVFLKLYFILEKNHLKRNLTIILTLITKNNFTLSYPNKNYSFKLTFDTFKLNKNYSFKNNFSKNNYLKKIKNDSPKIKLNVAPRYYHGHAHHNHP